MTTPTPDRHGIRPERPDGPECMIAYRWDTKISGRPLDQLRDGIHARLWAEDYADGTKAVATLVSSLPHLTFYVDAQEPDGPWLRLADFELPLLGAEAAEWCVHSDALWTRKPQAHPAILAAQRKRDRKNAGRQRRRSL